ncbi:TPA: hypothetical protein DEB04_03425 [Candidatus Giovannonibacteria bacterium]|nr:MAG: hypothetical protein A3D61_01380 [Candidatus Giovannonibacteria bacterium RIFCSPHIGHO2_02_FULL_48_15]HBT81742.1 hypothetical protein [Candidatus Giovannonibacteria bacterium]
MPKITFSAHARYQLKERNLSEREVKRALRNPDKIYKQSANRFRAIKMSRKQGKGYLVVVVYETINSTQEIITVFITSKIKKYL